MRAVAKAAPRPRTVTPPPAYVEHEFTLRLPHDVFELAVWAFRYEQDEDDELARLHRDRTFEEFLADCVEAGLETPVERWRSTQT